jgi:hypothetical protein
MQVLGDLIRLPETSSLPLPWWHRAPLGLIHGTDVYVALVDSQGQGSGRTVPDLVISVFELHHWDKILSIRCRREDNPGVILAALEAVRDHNVVLAESVTLEFGNWHEITLICQLQGGESSHGVPNQVKTLLQERGFKKISTFSFDDSPLIVKWHDTGRVNHGWIHGTAYRKAIDRICREPNWNPEPYDLSRAVVSADTEKRILRYVFPKKNAFTISVRHADTPGMLLRLCDILSRKCDLNVLSAVLRRGGQRTGNAELVAVCEPNRIDSQCTKQVVRDSIAEIDQRFRVSLKRLSDGRSAREAVWLGLSDVERMLRGWPVLVADRFLPDTAWGRDVRMIIENFVAKSGFRPRFETRTGKSLMGSPGIGKRIIRSHARGAIVPLAALDWNDANVLIGLTSELSALSALDKSILILTDMVGLPPALESWCAKQGVQVLHGALGDPASCPPMPSIVEQALVSWLSRLGLDGDPN